MLMLLSPALRVVKTMAGRSAHESEPNCFPTQHEATAGHLVQEKIKAASLQYQEL
jgi:hypothetical protein